MVLRSHRRKSEASTDCHSLSDCCLFANARTTLPKGNRSSTEDLRDSGVEDETVVDAEQGNGTRDLYQTFACDEVFTDGLPILIVLMHLIKQLRPGADLSRVTLPTFILEPRSMLERITK